MREKRLILATTGFKFVSEKVSHHPPVMAFYAEAQKWRIDGHIAPSQKFWGRSMVRFSALSFLVAWLGTMLTIGFGIAL